MKGGRAKERRKMANLEYEVKRMVKAFKTAEKELYNFGKEFTKQLKIASQSNILNKKNNKR